MSKANFLELRACEVRRIPIPRTWVNKQREGRKRPRYRRMEPTVETIKQEVLLWRLAIAIT
jgi:hypothetical protein